MRRIFLLVLALTVSVMCFGQTGSLDKALVDASVYLGSCLPQDSRVVILNMSTESEPLSDYLIDELAVHLVNNGRLIVVDRQSLELIRQEMNFQMSGEVSDETAQSIGRKLGAQYIISGSLIFIGSAHRMRVQAISVENARIVGMQSFNISSGDRVIAALTAAKGLPAGAEPEQTVSAVPYTAPYTDTGMKPEKKIPARKGNFEIIQGAEVHSPIDMDKFRGTAIAGLDSLKYRVESEGTGYILFAVTGRDWWAHIKLCYWEDEYWYEYVDSNNLDANPARNRIHRNYRNWIERVERVLSQGYYSLR